MGNKSKKHKKHKKTKKSKHQKRDRTKRSVSSQSSAEYSSSSSEEWIEKAQGNKKEEAKHDDWMSQMSFGPTYSSKELKLKNVDEEELKKKESQRRMLEPGQSDRELNPYWKNGGTGLPEERSNRDVKSNSSSAFNADYLKEVLEKAKQQAEEENKSLESVVASRYGSLQTLYKMISLAERKHNSSKYEQGRSSSSSSRFRKPTNHVAKIGSSSAVVHTEQSATNVEKLSDSNSDAKPRTDEEMNQLASKLLKAEIMGNKKLIDELTEELNKARQVREAAANYDTVKTVTLMHTNKFNYSQPVRGISSNDGKLDKRKKNFETHADGKRVKYFEDDDKYSLNEMFEREKILSAADSNAEFIRLSSKRKSTDSDDFVDLCMDQSTSNQKKKDKELQKSVEKHRKAEKVLDNCLWCLANNKIQKHLIISSNSKVYLSLPYFKSLTEGHCLITPIYHATCTTLLDEDVWEEILDYCKKLTNMFRANNQDVVFFESAMNFKHYPHMVMHCVPLPYEVGNLAPIYFKKAIMECEKEWAQNKKLVNVNKLEIKKSVPKGLPYFAVHFGIDMGYAHVIENEKNFPRNFAQEIIGGLLDLDHRIWRKTVAEGFEAHCKKVNSFKKLWKKVET